MAEVDDIAGLIKLFELYMAEGRSGPSMEWLRLLVAKGPPHAPLVAAAESILREENEAWYLLAMAYAGRSREYCVSMDAYSKVFDSFAAETVHRVKYLDACRFHFMKADTLECVVDFGMDEDAIRCHVDDRHQADFFIQPIMNVSKIELPGKHTVWPLCDPRKWMGAAFVWHSWIAANEAVPKHRGCRVKIVI